jgi:HlyD family secretion protein
MIKKIHNIAIGLALLFITAVAIASPTTLTVHAKTSITELHFNGALDPIKSTAVLSPIDGTITAMHFKFGSEISKGQSLFTLDSTSLEKNYRDAISTYLKAKQQLDASKKEYATDKLLFKAGVLSQDELTAADVTVETNKISLLQGTIDLKKVLAKTNIDVKKVTQLSLTQADAVNKLLSRRMKDLTIKSPNDGVALFPLASANQSDSNSTPIQVGSNVHAGNYMLSIGDLSGFSTTTNVSEININKIKKSQDVIVTGNAFPSITLHGVVSSVDSQAQQSSDSSNMSLFKIYIDIPHITPAAKKIIHVGMTAAISIKIQNPKQIIVPIDAVRTENNINYVTKITTTGNEKTKVTTGSTTPTGVVIAHGLKDGDKIIIQHAND